MAAQAEAGGCPRTADLGEAFRLLQSFCRRQAAWGAEDWAEKAVLEEWLPAGPTVSQILPEGGALCTCLTVPSSPCPPARGEVVTAPGACSASHGPIPSFSEERRGTAQKLHSQDSVPLQCVTRETAPRHKLSPVAWCTHTRAPQPRAHHTLCARREALGQELRTVTCRDRGSWRPALSCRPSAPWPAGSGAAGRPPCS